MVPLPDNPRGALWMTLSMAGFVVNDTLVKLVSGEMGLFQLIFIRGLMATALIAAMAWRAGALSLPATRRDGRFLGMRVVAEMAAVVLFLTALFNMPLANVTAILQAAPLAITLAAALVLAEPVGWRRVSAILVGFAGVMLIVRPGTEGFSVFSLAALGAVVCVTLRELATRQLSAGVPSLVVVLATSAAVTLMGGAVALTQDWAPVAPASLALLACAAVAVTVGYLFGVLAVRAGELAFVAPFRYSILIWALILGYAVFGDLPSLPTLGGAVLIVGSGVYSFRREQLLARRAAIAARERVEGARGLT